MIVLLHVPLILVVPWPLKRWSSCTAFAKWALDFGLPYWDYPLGKESNRGHAQRGRHTHDRKNSSELEYLSAAQLRLPHPSRFSAPRACKIRASAVRLGSDSSTSSLFNDFVSLPAASSR
jgi:hypothetical protein